MYTELIFGCSLKKSTPSYITEALNHVINNKHPYIISEEASKFIDDYKLNKLIWCSSFYFGVNNAHSMCFYNTTSEEWVVSFRSNCKNYDNEIEAFITFITPFVAQGSGSTDIFAIVQYEEADYPTLYSKDDVYNYLDTERITSDRKLANQMFDIMNELYNCATPDLQITNEMLKEKGIDPDDYSGVDGYKIMRDVIVKRLKDIGYGEEFANLAKENQNLKEKLMYMEFDRDDYKDKVKQLKEELEEYKNANSIIST